MYSPGSVSAADVAIQCGLLKFLTDNGTSACECVLINTFK